MEQKDWFGMAVRATLRVSFLCTKKEQLMYCNALYSAMLWGWKDKTDEVQPCQGTLTTEE